jgi:ABC-type branched-subunit amino acid transport system substrate-binding protein/TolA-binding protein
VKNSIHALVVAVLFVVGCATAPQPKEQAAASLTDELAVKNLQVEAPARAQFVQAERAYKARKYKVAADGYRALKSHFPGGAAAQISSYRLGSIFYQTANYPQAAQELQAFLTHFPNSELAFDVGYNLAAAEYQQGHYDKAFDTIRHMKPEMIRAQGTKRADVVYQLAAQAAGAIGNHGAVVAYHTAQLQIPVDSSRRPPLETTIVSNINQMTAVDELTQLLNQTTDPVVRGKLSERIALLSTQTTPAPAMPGVAPIPSEVSPGAAAAELTASAATTDRSHVGVVLPLSGANAPYGKKALDGILLAAGIFRNDSQNMEIFVEDSGSNPATAAQAVEKLVNEHNVIAVIGPISYKESVAAGDKAQELGVLNLSLTGKEGVSERGTYLFQNALTPRVQMENLVKHCIQEKHFRRFAILAPENSFGEDMAGEFTAVANKLGGHIVGYETYPPETKDFQAPVQKLAGVSDPRYRKMESNKLDTFIKEQTEKTRRPSKARLPPIVDFDAVFLPDGPRAAAAIAASLAYFDVSGITLLGTSEWNSDQLYKRGGRLVEGAIFPAGLVLTSNNTKQREFVRQYADAYGGMPDLLAAQAYEAFELVARAAKSSAGSRNSAVSELAALTKFESPLGLLSMDPSRIALRALPILSLVPGGSIVEQ